MSVQKFKRSTTCKSDSIHSTYSFSQDTNLLQDYEYLLQKSAEELTKVKEKNQQLEHQLESIQPFNPQNNQYSTFQFNKIDLVVEELKCQNADLKIKLETKIKTNKKLKLKCKQLDQLILENNNLKKDIQDLLKEKINNKENRTKQQMSNSFCTSTTTGNRQQQSLSLSQKNDCSLLTSATNFKGLEEADKFLFENKLHSSRIQRIQIQKSPKIIKQPELQPIIIDFSTQEIQFNIECQTKFAQYLETIQFQAQEQLNQRLQQNRIQDLINAHEEMTKYIISLQEQLWIQIEKNKLQSECIQELMNQEKQNNNLQIFNQLKEIIAEINVNIQDNQDLSSNLNSINNQINLLNNNIEQTQKQFIIQVNKIDKVNENKENNCNTINVLKSKKKKITMCQVEDQEFELLQNEHQKLSKEIIQLQQQLDSLSEIQSNKNDLFEILELFNEDISYRENDSIKEQIIQQIQLMQEQYEEMKKRYLDLLYKIILNQIKTDSRRTELMIKNDVKLQDSMKWLLQSTQRKQNFQTITFMYCDTLTDFILKKENQQTRMSELHEIISMQMRVIYTLLQQIQRQQGVSQSRTSCFTQKGDNLLSSAIKDLRELNLKLNNLPENINDIDNNQLKSNILKLCNKISN